MSTTHTPGLWYYDQNREEVIVADDDGMDIRVIVEFSYFDDDREANGRLIAAAPDYDAAAETLLKWFDSSGSGVSARWDRIPHEERLAIVNSFRAARQKARGQ